MVDKAGVMVATLARGTPAHLACCALVLAHSSCAGQTGPSGPNAQVSSRCRGAEQPGCIQCCKPGVRDDGAPLCHVSWRSFSGDPRPGYNRRNVYSGVCQAGCRPCADCTEDEERVYRRIVRSGCDCLGQRPDCGWWERCSSAGNCCCICRQLPSVAQCRTWVEGY